MESKEGKHMQTIALAIFSLALISTTLAVPFTYVAKAKADNNILNMLAESNMLSGSAEPEITIECFNHFIPILNQISTNFSVQYEQCVTVATQAEANLSTSAAQNRATFVNETSAICSAFTSCNSDSDNLNFFDCYATAASTDVNEIYNLSKDAANAAISLKGGLQLITDTEEICTNNAQLAYAAQTSETYKELNACFVNGL
ncbi:uncharacterized protein [Bactrocera oleae]|uniref:uncharacterized protein n=1 Tax=Bactrocera oleae TaxID=104688 RepID=UPI00387ED0B8